MRISLLRKVALAATLIATSTMGFAAKYTGGVSINIDENINFNFNIAGQGNRNATAFYTSDIAIVVEGVNGSTYDRSTMEKVVGLMVAVKKSYHEFTGITSLPNTGAYRNIPTIQVPGDNNGAGGLAGHGTFGLSVGRAMFDDFHNRVRSGTITVDQVWLYEMNRNFFLTRWNDHIDWTMDRGADDWGWWTVGFNNAAAIWILDEVGVGLEYFGQDRARFRAVMMKQLDAYLSSSSYTFDNAWTKALFPWDSRNSINDMMTAVLVSWYEQFGGKDFIKRMYGQISKMPRLSNRYDYQTARDNWFRMVSRASGKNLTSYFEQTLKWPLSASAKSQIQSELGTDVGALPGGSNPGGGNGGENPGGGDGGWDGGWDGGYGGTLPLLLIPFLTLLLFRRP